MKMTTFFTGFFSLVFAASFASAAAKPNHKMKEVLDELQTKGGKPIETLSATEARKQPTPADAVKSMMGEKAKKPDMKGLASVEDIQITGAAGNLPARVYKPKGKGPFPLIVYFHGGGWVIANLDVYDATPRSLAREAKAIVLSAHYRLAPENKFPAAHEDAFAAYKWALANAANLGADPARVALVGESAGGNLAVNVAIRARDENLQRPISEVLVYPVAGSDMNTASYQENADAKPLNKAMMGWFMANYLNSPKEASDPRINLVAANLKDLPPTTIITAQIDPLRSEGKELADKMQQQGVKVDYKNFDGVTHEFFGMASVLSEAKKAQKMAVKDLKHTF